MASISFHTFPFLLSKMSIKDLSITGCASKFKSFWLEVFDEKMVLNLFGLGGGVQLWGGRG